MSIDDPCPPDIIYTSHLLRGTNLLNNLKKGPVFLFRAFRYFIIFSHTSIIDLHIFTGLETQLQNLY